MYHKRSRPTFSSRVGFAISSVHISEEAREIQLQVEKVLPPFANTFL